MRKVKLLIRPGGASLQDWMRELAALSAIDPGARLAISTSGNAYLTTEKSVTEINRAIPQLVMLADSYEN